MRPSGAPGDFAARSEAVLSTLVGRLKEFGNIAISVSVMNKSLTALRAELDELKTQQSTSGRKRSSVTSEEPQNKTARIELDDVSDSYSALPVCFNCTYVSIIMT